MWSITHLIEHNCQWSAATGSLKYRFNQKPGGGGVGSAGRTEPILDDFAQTSNKWNDGGWHWMSPLDLGLLPPPLYPLAPSSPRSPPPTFSILPPGKSWRVKKWNSCVCWKWKTLADVFRILWDSERLSGIISDCLKLLQRRLCGTKTEFQWGFNQRAPSDLLMANIDIRFWIWSS